MAELKAEDFTCQACGARPGQRCVTARGRFARQYHADRTERWSEVVSFIAGGL
jgi:hypothetical protein